MTPMLLWVVLTSAPFKIALPGFNAVNVSKEEAALYAEVVAQKLMERPVRVLTGRDLESMLGLERQRQLLGCADGSTCIVEVVAALGVDAVLVGDLGRVPEGYVVNAKLLSTTKGTPLALFSGRVKRAENLRALLNVAVWELTRQLGTALGRPELMPTDAKPELNEGLDPRWWAVLPAAVAVGGGVASGVFFSQSRAQAQLLGQATSLQAAQSARDAGKSAQTAMVASAVAGGVGIAVAAALLIGLSGPPGVAPTVMVSPTGASLGVAGVWP